MVDCVSTVNFIGEAVEWRQSMPWESDYPFGRTVRFKNGEERSLQRGDIFLAGDTTYIFDGHEAQVIGPVVTMISEQETVTMASEPENVTIADKIPTNCKNCGAPLSGRHSCRYCETWN